MYVLQVPFFNLFVQLNCHTANLRHLVESGTSWMTLEEASTDDDEGEMMDSDGELNVTNGDREDMSDHAELDLSRVRDVPSLGYSVAGRDA